MKSKKLETAKDVFEWLRHYLHEAMDDAKEALMFQLPESTEFSRGEQYGIYNAFCDMDEQIRGYLKHGFDHLQIEDYAENEK